MARTDVLPSARHQNTARNGSEKGCFDTCGVARYEFRYGGCKTVPHVMDDRRYHGRYFHRIHEIPHGAVSRAWTDTILSSSVTTTLSVAYRVRKPSFRLLSCGRITNYGWRIRSQHTAQNPSSYWRYYASRGWWYLRSVHASQNWPTGASVPRAARHHRRHAYRT